MGKITLDNQTENDQIVRITYTQDNLSVSDLQQINGKEYYYKNIYREDEIQFTFIIHIKGDNFQELFSVNNEFINVKGTLESFGVCIRMDSDIFVRSCGHTTFRLILERMNNIKESRVISSVAQTKNPELNQVKKHPKVKLEEQQIVKYYMLPIIDYATICPVCGGELDGKRQCQIILYNNKSRTVRTAKAYLHFCEKCRVGFADSSTVKRLNRLSPDCEVNTIRLRAHNLNYKLIYNLTNSELDKLRLKLHRIMTSH